MLRRLEKRILVDLPTPEARKSMLEQYLPPVIPSEGSLVIKTNVDYEQVAKVSGNSLWCINSRLMRVQSNSCFECWLFVKAH